MTTKLNKPYYYYYYMSLSWTLKTQSGYHVAYKNWQSKPMSPCPISVHFDVKTTSSLHRPWWTLQKCRKKSKNVIFLTLVQAFFNLYLSCRPIWSGNLDLWRFDLIFAPSFTRLRKHIEFGLELFMTFCSWITSHFGSVY